jgi:hypothetical protein
MEKRLDFTLVLRGLDLPGPRPTNGQPNECRPPSEHIHNRIRKHVLSRALLALYLEHPSNLNSPASPLALAERRT